VNKPRFTATPEPSSGTDEISLVTVNEGEPNPDVISLVDRLPRPGREEDAELAIRAARGEAEPFEQLYRRYERIVKSVVRSETQHQADVDDIVQDVFASAWLRIGSLRDPASFRPWLLQITRHTVIDAARARSRRPLLDADDEIALSFVETLDPQPDELSELADLAQQLRGAIAGLSRRDATAVTLAAQFGFGPAEIAEAIGTTPNAAKVVLHRARLRLKAAIR
jgi:RNA polymerase sigma factor (sigma-70 family)